MRNRQMTATEYRVRIRTSLGTIRTEWVATREAADDLATRYEVIDILLTTHPLDW